MSNTMTTKRIVYELEPRIKSTKRRQAIKAAYSTLKCWSVSLANAESDAVADLMRQRPVIARDLAEKTRELIAAFGVRSEKPVEYRS